MLCLCLQNKYIFFIKDYPNKRRASFNFKGKENSRRHRLEEKLRKKEWSPRILSPIELWGKTQSRKLRPFSISHPLSVAGKFSWPSFSPFAPNACVLHGPLYKLFFILQKIANWTQPAEGAPNADRGNESGLNLLIHSFYFYRVPFLFSSKKTMKQ